MSLCKQLPQFFQHGILNACMNVPQFFDQPRFIHRSNLIENHLTFFSLKPAFYTRWIWPPSGRHWRYNDSLNVAIHLVW